MRNNGKRMLVISILTIVLAIVCTVRLFDLQIIKGSDYKEQAEQRLIRAYSVKAPRGEIVDRNGKAIVKNRMGYMVRIQKVDMSEDELNDVLCKTGKLVAEYGSEIQSDFPIIVNENTDKLDYDFEIEKNGGVRKFRGVKLNERATEKKREASKSVSEKTEKTKEEIEQAKKDKEEALSEWKKKNKLTEYNTAEQVFEYYKSKYGVSSEYKDDESLAIVSMRYAMEKSNFSEKNPYVLASDIDEYAVQEIKERFMDFPGVEVATEPIREYENGTMAAHILGRTGKIYAEEYAEMKDQGYGINDVIGKDGLEKILESYLKGKDGYKSVEMNRGGGITQILQSRDPEPGNYAKLTIDYDLQEVTEKALKEAVTSAVGSGGAGAAVAIDPKTGGVLSIASYPTYDLTTFNEDYDDLLNSKSKPLINRALNGTYSPGSTFKPLTSVAALESGIINPNTYITDLGRYTYYDSYQPTCLVYSSTGSTHGTINVSEAIGVSCNYFFYEVGRQMGIETIDEYAEKFGLGQKTGIELSESTGVLAGPEEREKAGGIWYPGDVLQAAIGQSDNMFTPVQLASYISTILNKGTRYRLHLIDEVVNYDTGEVVMKNDPEVLSETKISDSTYAAVTDGMRRVVTTGTAKVAFASSKYQAAGKTGTAEVPDGADNVLFVGFAPYDNPEIVVAVIIEHGASSIHAANTARKIFDAYMQLKDGTYNKNSDESDRVDSATGEKSTDKNDVNSKTNNSDSESSKKSTRENTVDGVIPGGRELNDEDKNRGEGTL